MPWKLSRWKTCDGGCCVRSPRFPNPGGGPDPERPAYMADCIYHLNEPGGTSPDGTQWRGGCQVYKELLTAIANRNAETNMNRLRLADIMAQPTLRQLVNKEIRPALRESRGEPIQWFGDTCWKWPVMTPLISALWGRAKSLGLVADDPGFSPVLMYDRVYTDEEREAMGQEFHVTWEQVQSGEAATVPASCCHVWEAV